ncbi:MAG: glycosyltransferase family 2 protein [Thermoplasmataceae archaeon]
MKEKVNMNEFHMISVVITAHDRKRYLKSAVESILQQTIDPNSYEIIVVKNYHDDQIDEYLHEKGVYAIYTELDSFGEKIYAGIMKCSGKIITFLDDDDQFSSEKLSKIVSIFDKNRELVYFHNGIELMNENGKFDQRNEKEIEVHPLLTPFIDLKAFKILSKMRGDWYVSCISMKRSIALKYSEIIKNSSKSLDRVLFLVSSLTQGEMLLSNERLTLYRMHESVTGIKANFKMYCSKKKDFFNKTFTVLESLKQIGTENPIIMKYLNIQKDHNRANFLLYEPHGKRKLRITTLRGLIRAFIRVRDPVFLYLSVILLISVISPMTISYFHYLYQKMKIT